MCATFYLRVGEPTRLITGSIQVSWVLCELGQKSTIIEIYKKNSTQPASNPWWVRLTHKFQSILTALCYILFIQWFKHKYFLF